MLSEGGANPDGTNQFGLSALHWASMMEDVIMMDILIKAGADVNIRSHDCTTPLHVACREENPAAVAMLLRSAPDYCHCHSLFCIHHSHHLHIAFCT